jgi:hypothetical protein
MAKRSDRSPSKKEKIAADRKKKKEDTTVDNCRNRLIQRFGERVVQKLSKDGDVQGLYSESQDQEELFLRAFDRVRGHHFEPRHRVVSIGLRTALKDTSFKQDIVVKLNELVEYFSKLRVYASLFANFVAITCLSTAAPLPVVDDKFFRNCFGVFFRPDPANPLSPYMARFTQHTGISTLPSIAPSKEIKNDQAAKLWTATKTRMDVHYHSRVKGVASWVLRTLLREHHPDMQDKAFTTKINKLVTFLDSRPDDDAVVAELRHQGFERAIYVDAVTVLFQHAKFKAKDQDTVTARIQHWYDLQRLYVDEPRRRFESLVRVAMGEHPGKTKACKTARSTFIKKNFGSKAPPKILAPLPFASPKAAFIRIDKSTMQRLFPALNVQMGPWGYGAFLSPYTKKANIRCLRTGTWGSSEHGMMEAIGNAAMTKCPWLVAPTFETDGEQIKLCLMTSHATTPGPPGLRYLHEAGYNLRTKNVPLEGIIQCDRGVYNDTGIVYGDRSTVDKVCLGVVDPGILKPINAIFATGADWRNLHGALLHEPAFQYVVVDEQDIKKMYNRGQTTHNECVRRAHNPGYGQGMKTLWKFRKKTSRLQDLVAYCRAWKAGEDSYWTEILKRVRKVRRFERFRNTQTQVQNIRKKLTSHLQGRQGLLVFGDGSFKAMRGHISVPRKQIVRACACVCAVVIGNEWGSSKYCPLCKHELVNLDGGEGRRTRVCKNALCCADTFDRDDGGCVGIIDKLLGRFGAPVRRRRRQPAQEEEDDYTTDDELSDVEQW